MNKSFFIKSLCGFSLLATISLDASAATTCKAGYYLKNDKCVICPAGQISTEGAYKSCTTCPAGQYEKGHKLCISCEAGYYCVDGKKNRCPAGSYCPAESSKPTACTGNQYTRTSGQKTYKVCDGERQIVNEKHTGCITCPSDQEPNAEHTACIGKCTAGQYYTAGKCKDCEAGYYCADGKKRTACSAGTYNSNTKSTSAAACVACAGNQYTSSSGEKTYKLCDGERQIVNEKHTGCKTCPSDQEPNAEHTACVGKCTAGQYYTGGKCKDCNAGYYCVDGKKNRCPAGSYCPAGSSEPTACTGNQYTSTSGQKTYKLCNGERQIVNEKHTGCITCPSDQEPNAEHTACVAKIKKCTADHGAKTPTACSEDKPICDQNTGVCQACPSGSKYANGQCVKPEPVCPSDQTLNKEGKCVCKSRLPQKPDGVCLTSWEEVEKISCKEGNFNSAAQGLIMNDASNIPYAEFYNLICRKCPENATCDGIKLFCNEGYEKEGIQCVEHQKKCTADHGAKTPTACGEDKPICDQNTGVCQACPSGSKYANGQCVKPEPVCPSDQTLNKEGKCVCASGLPKKPDGVCLTSWEEVKKISCKEGKFNIIAEGWGMGVGDIPYDEFYNSICHECPKNAICDGIKILCNKGYKKEGSKCVEPQPITECQEYNDQMDVVNRPDLTPCRDNGYCKNGTCIHLIDTGLCKEKYDDQVINKPDYTDCGTGYCRNGVCIQCGENQYYNSQTKACECPGDLILQNGICVRPEPIIWCKQNFTGSDTPNSCPIDRPICKNSTCEKCTADADCLFDTDNGVHHQGARCDSNGMCVWAESIACPDPNMVVNPKTLECMCRDGFVVKNGICVSSGGVDGGVKISHLDNAVVYQTGDNDYPVKAVCPANSTCVWNVKCGNGYSNVNGSCIKAVQSVGGAVGVGTVGGAIASGTNSSILNTTGTLQQSEGERVEIASAEICKKGQYTNNRGNCVTCPAGYYCPDPAGTAKPCPANTYNPKKGSTAKTACLKCSYSTNLGSSTCEPSLLKK